MEREDKLRKNLVTLFTLFKTKPNLLAKYIIDNDLLSNRVEDFLIDNKELTKRSEEFELNGEINIPYFTSFNEMQTFYSKFFETYEDIDAIKSPIKEKTTKESLRRDLLDAISVEDYEKCAKIRDYCIKKGIDLSL